MANVTRSLLCSFTTNSFQQSACYYLSVKIRPDYTISSFKRMSSRIMYSTPLLTEDEKKKITSVAGIHIGFNSISWARIEIHDNTLTHLGMLNLPENLMKQEMDKLYFTTVDCIDKIPSADKYVIENRSVGKMPGTRRSDNIQLASQTAHLLITAMLVALLNQTSELASVIFLKQRLAARVFDILVGNEQVSTRSIVDSILSGKQFGNSRVLTPNSNLFERFKRETDEGKEILGIPLLLTCTFLDLIYYQNSGLHPTRKLKK